MASLTVVLTNGDVLSLGCAADMGNAAYEAIIGAESDFVSLGALANMPRLAVRTADVLSAIFDPNDTTTQYFNSALAKVHHEQQPPPAAPLHRVSAALA